MTERRDPPRYPGYDTLAKRHTPSWNEPTRRVIDRRLAVPRDPQFLGAAQLRTLEALCEAIVPQPAGQPPIPVASLVDGRLARDEGDGFRPATLPPLREAWTRGLDALEAEAQARHGESFARLAPAPRDALVALLRRGELDDPAWGDMSPGDFYNNRASADIVSAYYSHPSAWNDIGFGGPASPRGYVRLDGGMRDPWDAAEAEPGREDRALRANRHVV